MFNVSQTSYNAILIESSPKSPIPRRRTTKNAPPARSKSDILDEFFQSDSDSDSGLAQSRHQVRSPIKPATHSLLNLSSSSHATRPTRKSISPTKSISPVNHVSPIRAVSPICEAPPLCEVSRTRNRLTTIKTQTSSLFVPQSPDSALPTPQLVANKNLPAIFLHDSSSSEDYDDVVIAKHDVILSSSPIRESDNDLTSSIGSIQAAKPSKPLIPKSELAKMTEYEYDKRLISTERSNPFLDKLVSNASGARQRYEKTREEPLKKRAEKSTVKSIPSNQPSSNDSIISSPIRSSPSRRSPLTHKKPTILSEPLQSRVIEPQIERPAVRFTTDVSAARNAIPATTKQQQREELRRLKEANKVSRTKEQLLGEMIIHVPKTVMSAIKHKKCECELEGVEVRESFREDPYVTWQRNVTSEYDSITDSFIPTSPRVIDEDKCCFVYDAKEFVTMMEMETLLTRFTSFRAEHPQYPSIVIFLVEWEQLIQKLKNAENRRYTERMRGGEVNQPKRKKKQSIEDTLDLKELEETIIELQVHGFKVFPTKNVHETSIWLKSFTYAIASARYDKLVRNPDFANVGTIKSGKDVNDTYFQMLLQLKFMTEVRARRVVEALPTLTSMITSVQRGRLPIGRDGRTVMHSNIELSVMKLFSSTDENELLNAS